MFKNNHSKEQNRLTYIFFFELYKVQYLYSFFFSISQKIKNKIVSFQLTKRRTCQLKILILTNDPTWLEFPNWYVVSHAWKSSLWYSWFSSKNCEVTVSIKLDYSFTCNVIVKFDANCYVTIIARKSSFFTCFKNE